VVLFQQPGTAAFARLAVDPDHRFIAAANVARIERQVGDLPAGFLPRCTFGKAFADGVLMGAGKGGKDQLTGIRVARMQRQLITRRHRLNHLLHIAEIKPRRHALGVEIQRQRHQINVAGALAVAKQAALDAIGPRQ